MSNLALYPLFFFQKRSKKRGKREVESEEVYDEPNPVSEDTAVSFNAETTDKVIILLDIMTVLCMDYQIPQQLNWNHNRMFALD